MAHQEGRPREVDAEVDEGQDGGLVVNVGGADAGVGAKEAVNQLGDQDLGGRKC
jgi:hypothetical protein